MELELNVNGESRSFDGPLTVAGLVQALDIGGRRVAIEVNGEVVPRSRHPEHELADGDRVEIVHAIGGG